MNPALQAIGHELRTQDNECTANPMFCIQILKVEAGFAPEYGDAKCWWNAGLSEVVYDDEPEGADEPGSGWEEFGYKERWETIMVCFTRKGAEQYFELDGHNIRRRAHKQQVRVMVESFCRCPEMIAIREFLMAQGKEASDA